MKRFKNILYLVDSDSIKDHVVAEKIAHLAKINGASVTMMWVEGNTLVDELGKLFSGKFKDAQQELMRYHQLEIERFADHQRWADVTIDRHICLGKDFIEIIRKVLRGGHDLVIKEESLDHGIDQLAMRLVRKCPCPVWVIKRGSYSFGRVLAALDVESCSEESLRLNRKIVELSSSLALREDGEAFYLHAWRLESELMLRSSRFSLSAEEIKQIKQSIVVERHGLITELFAAAEISPCEDHILVKEGESGDLIRQMVNKLSIDVVVMGSVARAGIPGLLIGNKAEKLLGQINCTVMTVKPDGFVSPIKLERLHENDR